MSGLGGLGAIFPPKPGFEPRNKDPLARPPGDGWHQVLHVRPPRDALLELWRLEWGNDTRFARPTDFPPEFNVANLYWRLAE